MSDQENVPVRKAAAAVGQSGCSIPGRVETGGAVRSTVTGWLARSQARAIEHITTRTRNETALLQAQAELAATYEATALSVNRLRRLPELLALDDAKFDAELEAEYERIEERRYDEEHVRQVRHYVREKEVEDAATEVVEAERKNFTAAQGFENQRRLKERNLKIWDARAETFQLDAEAKAAKVRGQLGSTGAAADIYHQAEGALAEALADGNDVEADRWQKVLDVLAELDTPSPGESP